MSANKGKLTKRPIGDFVPSVKDNERWSLQEETGFGFKVDTYALLELEEKIVDSEAILTPLIGVAKGNKVQTLVGNRRTFAGLNLKSKGKKLAEYILEQFPGLFYHRDGQTGIVSTDRNERDPEVTASNVLAALDAVPVELYEKLTEQEMDEILHDKGKEKRIRKSETLKACFKLFAKGYPEKYVAKLMYHQLADVTGNVTKIDYINSIKDPRKRDAELTKWTHGTLGGFYLSVWLHDERMRRCLMLSFLREDKLIPNDEQGNPVAKPEIQLTHSRWRKLKDAIKKDHADGKCTENAKTSPSFEALIQQYKDQDGGMKPPPSSKDTRIKQEMLLGMADMPEYDPTAKLALKVAAGAASSDELQKLSESNLRDQGVLDILRRTVQYIPAKEKFTGAQVNDLINGIIRDLPMEFIKVVTPFLNKEGQELLAGQAVPQAKATTVAV